MHMPHGLNGDGLFDRHLKQLLSVFGQGFTRSAFAKFVANARRLFSACSSQAGLIRSQHQNEFRDRG
jgi:hypothetical protein